MMMIKCIHYSELGTLISVLSFFSRAFVEIKSGFNRVKYLILYKYAELNKNTYENPYLVTVPSSLRNITRF